MAALVKSDCDPAQSKSKQLKRSVIQQQKMAGRLLTKALELKHSGQMRGMQRVERKIRAEKTFLESLLSGSTEAKEEHVNCSNLLYLEAVLHVCEQATAIVAVQQSFSYVPETGSHSKSVTVDVVAHEGGSWIKVFARNRKALHTKWLGDGNYGDKTVTDFANEFISASHHNLIHFEPPKIMFAFFGGVTESIADELSGMGVEVAGPVFPDDSEEPSPSLLEVAATIFKPRSYNIAESPVLAIEPLRLPEVKTPECVRVNLDVSTMIAWVSGITHGGASHQFEDPTLREQAEQEREIPLWPLIQAVTKGKELLSCQTAVDVFEDILETIGGPEEKERGRELMDSLTVVRDEPSERALRLEDSGKVKHRSKVIFGTGDSLRAMTATGNEAFVRAASHQGVSFDVWIHSSRSLAERAILELI